MFNANINKGAIGGLNFTDIFYADDTLLLTKDSQSASFLLQHIEEESKYYNMKLNEDKCEVLPMNCNGKVKFKSGKFMNNVDQATYLG